MLGKIGKLENELYIDPSKSCSFSGITQEKIKSKGISKINFNIYETYSDHEFHIVEDRFPIPVDGILGSDFFTKYLCKIDYETYTINLTFKNQEITIPMRS